MSVYTIDKMSDVELVALVLGLESDKEACGRIAMAMGRKEGAASLQLLETAREYGHIGERRIARLEASIELGRRALTAEALGRRRTISGAEDVIEVMRPVVAGLDREHFYALALNTKNGLIKLIEVSVGSLNASIVHPRELFRQAIAVSAASVVVCHNHPSGDPTPSGADIQLTRRLVKSGDVVGIEVLDHVVIGDSEHASLRDLGLM